MTDNLLCCILLTANISYLHQNQRNGVEGEAVARHLLLRSIDFNIHWVDLWGQGPDRCREYVNVFYIGPVPARTGRPNGYRNRSNEQAPQLFQKLWRTRECNHGNNFIWRLEVRTLGTHFDWNFLPFNVKRRSR